MSTPVNSDWSPCELKTSMLSTMSAGMLRMADITSLPKNSRPSTKTRCTVRPCASMTPSAISSPGILPMRAPASAPNVTLKAEAR